MPATVAHTFFSLDIYEILPKKFKENINIERFKMFAQSMDSLMFYNLFSLNSGKNIRDFTNEFHNSNTQNFFINLINYIKDKDIFDDTDVSSFLAGTISHYVLDSTLHPYIIYKTGFMNKKNSNTFKYNNLHAFMEVFIDNDMIRRRTNSNPYKFNMGEFCFNLKPFSKNLNDLLDEVFYKTFGIRSMSSIYFKSLKQMKFAINTFRRDPTGIKRDIYKFVDTFTPKNVFRFEAVSYHYTLRDKHNFLNSNHSLWRNPAQYDLTSTESFVDLYLKSIKIAKVLTCASFDYINGKNIELDKIFLNNGYLHGLNCDLKKELKYFEF